MSIILIDGPEKAGKSTMVEWLHTHHGARVRHWGPVGSDVVYAGALAVDVADLGLVVWDRGWPAEHVYGKLLGRDRRLAVDPWLGEWLYGMGVKSVGQQVILLGPSDDVLYRLRDGTDLPVDAHAEREAFLEYGERFNYLVLENTHDLEYVERWAEMMVSAALDNSTSGLAPKPPHYAGPVSPRVVFVGEVRDPGKVKFPGSWLPMSSRLCTMLARDLGDFALGCGWTNAAECPPQVLREVPCLVPCGRVAQAWVREHVNPGSGTNVVYLDHPAYIYRWKDGGRKSAKLEKRLAAHRATLQYIKEECA